MAKTYNKIIDDAIAEANEVASGKSKRISMAQEMKYMVDSGAMRSDPYLEVAVEVEKAIHIAIANALYIGRKAMNAYIQEEAEPIHKDFERIKGIVYVLDGRQSAKNLEQRAVRFEHLKSLNGMTSMPMAVKKAQSAPTKEEFNALVDAFYDLWRRIFEIEIQRRSQGQSPS